MRERIGKNIFERVERTLYAHLIIFESEKVCFSIKKQGCLFFLKIHSVGKMDARPG